mgnify:CR=1 FL=1
MTKEYPQLITSRKALLEVRTYLNDVLEIDVNHAQDTYQDVLIDHVDDAWFSGQRMALEDAINHIDNMINDIDTNIEAL